jgi:hypothetical protein
MEEYNWIIKRKIINLNVRYFFKIDSILDLCKVRSAHAEVIRYYTGHCSVVKKWTANDTTDDGTTKLGRIREKVERLNIYSERWIRLRGKEM